jgi:hypothetical protein
LTGNSESYRQNSGTRKQEAQLSAKLSELEMKLNKLMSSSKQMSVMNIVDESIGSSLPVSRKDKKMRRSSQ